MVIQTQTFSAIYQEGLTQALHFLGTGLACEEQKISFKNRLAGFAGARETLLEFDLNDLKKGIDVSLGYTRASFDLALLNSLLSSIDRIPSWENIYGFVDRWTDPASSEAACIRSVWLEVDAERPIPDYVPALFCRLSINPFLAMHQQSGLCLLDSIVSDLQAGGLEKPVDAIYRSIDIFSEICNDVWVGVFFSRTSKPIRFIPLIPKNYKVSALFLMLQKIGWRGTQNILEPILAALDTLHILISPAIDFYIDPQAGIAFELRVLKNIAFTSRRRAYSSFMDVLVGIGAINEHTKKALLSWMGALRMSNDCLAVRDINHFKLSVHDDGVAHLKAYLKLEFLYT